MRLPLLAAANNKFGLPARGLISLIVPGWDVKGRNILPVGSNNFVTGWTNGTGETCTVTDYPVCIPDIGWVTAKRVTGNGLGSSINKYYIQVSGLANPHTHCSSVYAMRLGGSAKISQSSAGYVAIGSEISRVSISSTISAVVTQFYLQTNTATDILDIVVYAPKIEIGATATASSPPLGLPQTLYDFSGKSNSFTLGATTAVGADDPTLSASGLNFTTDDIVVSAVVAGLDMQNFSRQIVGKFNGTTGVIMSLADPTSTTKYQAVKQVSSGNVAILSRNAGAETQSASLAVSNTDTVSLMLTAKDGTLTLENQSTGALVTLADTAPTTSCRLGTGCVAGSTVAQLITAQTVNVESLSNKAWNSSERKQAYWGAKKVCAAMGVTIA